ncbi:MAG: glutathionylspermidine synthase family protein [Verrucomicrobiales bacterium]
MKRVKLSPRPDWQAKVEQVGLTFHSSDGIPYWDESAAYEFTSAEIDRFETAGNELHQMCLKAAEHIIQTNSFALLGIPDEAAPLIIKSWERDDFSLYGRFDLACEPGGSPKLLEYNADTPTSLVEAAVAQWYWLEEKFPHADQFNSIHEKLIRGWKKLEGSRVHLGGIKEHEEDEQTVAYIMDTCFQGGVTVEHLFLDDLGFHPERKRFVDLENKTVTNYFKLFPWEWMWDSEYAQHLALETCRFIEPMWKMLLSNKAILPILWKLFPGHQNLLPATFSEEELRTMGVSEYVEKPKLSREGANVRVISYGRETMRTPGEYGGEGHIYQAFARMANFEGNHPVFGLWVVDHEACGLGIREDVSLVTGNRSRFVPHYFR